MDVRAGRLAVTDSSTPVAGRAAAANLHQAGHSGSDAALKNSCRTHGRPILVVTDMRTTPTALLLLCLILGATLPLTASMPDLTPNLHRLARWGQAELVRLLLENGADTEERDIMDRTALHHGARYPRVVRVLVEADANPNARDRFDNKFGPLRGIPPAGEDDARWIVRGKEVIARIKARAFRSIAHCVDGLGRQTLFGCRPVYEIAAT